MRAVARCSFQSKNGSLNEVESLNETRTIIENDLDAASLYAPTQTKQLAILSLGKHLLFLPQEKTLVSYFQ